MNMAQKQNICCAKLFYDQKEYQQSIETLMSSKQ